MISLEVHTVQRQLPCGKFSLFLYVTWAVKNCTGLGSGKAIFPARLI